MNFDSICISSPKTRNLLADSYIDKGEIENQAKIKPKAKIKLNAKIKPKVKIKPKAKIKPKTKIKLKAKIKPKAKIIQAKIKDNCRVIKKLIYRNHGE